MKAVVYESYGAPEVLQLKSVPKPVPKKDEILIRIHATSVTSGDLHMRKGDPWVARLFSGLRRPRKTILGHEFAGEVEAAGQEVTRFKPGDQVYGSVGLASGTYAQYRCLKADAPIGLKPAGLNYAEAATVPVGAMTALHFLRKARIEQGHKVLIYGASGSLGTYGVQLAKHFGAEVTAVCSAKNHALVRSLGADHVIDYHTQDFTQAEARYHAIFDAVGKAPIRAAKRVLHKNGRFCSAGFNLGLIVQGILTAIFGGKRVISGLAKESPADMDFLSGLIEAGELKPVIDRRYTMAELPAAHTYVDTGRKRGNVSIAIG